MEFIIFLFCALSIYALIKRIAKGRRASRQVRVTTVTDVVARDRIAKAVEKRNDQVRKARERIATADNEISFNREQRERLWKLLEHEQAELDKAENGTSAWVKHQKKVIALENQIHTVQSRIDKNQLAKLNAKRVIGGAI